MRLLGYACVHASVMLAIWYGVRGGGSWVDEVTEWWGLGVGRIVVEEEEEEEEDKEVVVVMVVG